MGGSLLDRLRDAMRPLATAFYEWAFGYKPEEVLAAWREQAEEQAKRTGGSK